MSKICISIVLLALTTLGLLSCGQNSNPVEPTTYSIGKKFKIHKIDRDVSKNPSRPIVHAILEGQFDGCRVEILWDSTQAFIGAGDCIFAEKGTYSDSCYHVITFTLLPDSVKNNCNYSEATVTRKVY